jgi:membrane-bound lytic murein transglycosylase D
VEDELEARLRQLDRQALEQSLTVNAFEDPNLPALEEEEGSLLDEITQEAIPENVDIVQWREERLEKTQSDLPLTLNDHVIRLINYFTEGKGRATLRATLGRSGAYRETIERILEEEDVPKELFYLAQAESGFRPKARSYARATGMWQFMAFRGKQYGLRQDRYLEERYDFEKATRAAARHLKDLYIEFGDWYLAFAAYNSGPGRVTRAIERGDTHDYWEMCRRQLLPRQTREYVPIILAMAYVDKNLDMYEVGTIDYAPEHKYDTVRIDSETSLDLIADITGSSVTELEQLNEALLRSATPPYDYDLRLPSGTGERLLTELERIPEDKRMQWRFHSPEEDVPLATVAKQYNVSEKELIAVNDLEEDASIVPAGVSLQIPTQTKLRVYRSYGGAGGLVESGGGRYRIASGDTLGGIARRFGVSVSQLRGWNGLPNTRIRAGRYLIVNPDGDSVGSSDDVDPGPSPDGVYQVRHGDTLGAIARRYSVTASQLQAWNGLRSTRIMVGQRLKVPTRGGSSVRTASASSASAPSGKYRVRSGDNLGEIANRFGVSVDDLRAWNGIRGTRITAGDYLAVRPGAASSDPEPAKATVASSNSGERYTVRSGDNLGLIADRFGTSVGNLRTWNGLRSNVIRPGQSLVVNPNGSSPSGSPREQTVASAPAPRYASSSNEVEYRIRPGDTLGGIADRFGVTTNDLRSWNKMRGSRIVAGETLVVRPLAPQQAAAAASPSVTPLSKAIENGGQYRVQSGDTLGAIAERHGIGVDDLMAWNGLASTRLTTGQSLLTRPPAGGSRYQVRPGDTLEVIAKRFNVSVDDLMRWNGLSSTRIRAGSYLTIRYSERAAGGDD